MLVRLNWEPPAEYQRVFDLEIEIDGRPELLRGVSAGETFEADDARAAELLSIVRPDGVPLFERA